MISFLKPRLNKNIDFLIIGAQKAGTSSFNHQLRSHPDIGLPKQKELHFFDHDKNFSNGPTYDQYHNHFRFWRKKSIYGETTPIYLYWRGCAERIYNYNPKIKLIVLLRNPIRRAFSHWNMEHQREREVLTFSEAIENEWNTLKSNPNFQDRTRSYIARGFYAKQLKQYLEYFPKEQFLIVEHTMFRQNPLFVLQDAFRFLGVEEQRHTYQERNFNTRKYNTELAQSDIEFLKKVFRPDIEELNEMFDQDFSDWLK